MKQNKISYFKGSFRFQQKQTRRSGSKLFQQSATSNANHGLSGKKMILFTLEPVNTKFHTLAFACKRNIKCFDGNQENYKIAIVVIRKKSLKNFVLIPVKFSLEGSPLDTGCILNVTKTFRRRLVQLLNVLCLLISCIQRMAVVNAKCCIFSKNVI